MALLNDVKTSLGISHSKKDNEIAETINAAFRDMKIAGGEYDDKQKESDAIVRQCIKLYCRFWFNYQGMSEQWFTMYEKLKITLSMSGEYRKAGTNEL